MTGPGAFWYNGAAAQILASQDITGTAAITVPQPAVAASGTVVVNITGTAAITVPIPVVAGAGTVVVSITGTAAITVPVPVVASSGTVTFTHTGTAAITVPVPLVNGSGSLSGIAAPAVGGRPRHRERVWQRTRFNPRDLEVRDYREGQAATSVKTPRVRGRGVVITPEEMEEDRLALRLAIDDPDFAFAVDDPWMN